MRTYALAPLLLAFATLPAFAQDSEKIDETNSATIPLPALGGWALKPDGETLIVSSPKTAEIIFINTSEDKEIKRVKVEFQPASLALRGSSLYALAKGSSLLFVLDSQTGKVKKQIRIPGAKPVQLALHPTNGPLYATNESYEVIAINTEAGKVAKTAAQGNFLAVSPKGEFLYTGTQKPMRDSLVLSRGPRNTVRVGVARSNRNSSIVKYSVKPKAITPVSMNGNAAINGRTLVVSPDGEKIAMVGGGGMQGEDGKRTYAIAVFSTGDLETQVGQIETGAYPADVCFHPVLDLGVAEKTGGTKELILFNAKSLAPLKSMQVGTRGTVNSEFRLLTFGARGTKLVSYSAGDAHGGSSRARSSTKVNLTADQPGQLHLIPLELTDDEKAQLAKAFPGSKR